MRGEEAPPPRGGQHPPLAVWAPVILTVRVVWHSFQVVRRVGSGRGPLGLWSASGGFVGVVIGRAQYVQAECYRGVRSRHTAVWRGAVHLRVRMYVCGGWLAEARDVRRSRELPPISRSSS